MITTPEIICDLFSFLCKDQIERIQLVNQFWNNVIIRHKNILPLRQFDHLEFTSDQISLYATKGDWFRNLDIYQIKFDGTNLRKIKQSPRYSQLTVDEVLTNLNDVFFDRIQINCYGAEDRWDDLLNMIKLVTTKTGGRFRGKFGNCDEIRFSSKLVEIFDNYIIVDQLEITDYTGCVDLYIREVCANPEIVQLPSTPKEIRLGTLEFEENDEVLHSICNGKLNGANQLTFGFHTSDTNIGNFIRQWFELYRTHQNPITLVGKFELEFLDAVEILDAVKTFLNNTQLRVKYSLETKEFHDSYDFANWSLKRPICKVIKRCVLYETDSYALVIEMEYRYNQYEQYTNMSSINASDLDQPPCDEMEKISFCVKSLSFYKNIIGVDDYHTGGIEETY